MMKLNDYVGMKRASEILRLSIPRVKQLARKGDIGRKVAGRFLFTPAELAAFSRKKRPAGRPKSIA